MLFKLEAKILKTKYKLRTIVQRVIRSINHLYYLRTKVPVMQKVICGRVIALKGKRSNTFQVQNKESLPGNYDYVISKQTFLTSMCNAAKLWVLVLRL